MDTINVILLCLYFYLNAIGTIVFHFEDGRPTGYGEWLAFIFLSLFFTPWFLLYTIWYVLDNTFKFKSWYAYFFDFSRFEKGFTENPNLGDFITQSWMNKILINLIKKKIEKRQKI